MFGENQHSSLSFPIFRGCDAEDTLRIEEYREWLNFRDGEYIFRENEPADGIFCLSKGAAKIIKTYPRQKEKIVSLAKEGDILGLRAVIEKTDFCSNAVAIVDSRLCFIPKGDVYEVIEKYPCININIMTSLCKQINEIEEKISLVRDKNIPKRVAEILVMLAQGYGLDRNNFLKITPCSKDLANLANITNSTLIRTLNEFGQEDLIAIQDKKIKILNPALLEEIAG